MLLIYHINSHLTEQSYINKSIILLKLCFCLRLSGNCKATALVSLDLSAAFDTTEHTVLHYSREHWFFISGTA